MGFKVLAMHFTNTSGNEDQNWCTEHHPHLHLENQKVKSSASFALLVGRVKRQISDCALLVV